MESKTYVPSGIIISEEEYNQLSGVGRTKVESEQGAMAICPAHNDHKPSLWLKINKDEKGRYWLNQKCHAGCSNKEVRTYAQQPDFHAAESLNHNILWLESTINIRSA